MNLPSPVIDSHAHVFVRGLPTGDRPRYLPAYDAGPEEYLSLLDRHGIAGAVLVQPSFLGVDNGFLLETLERHPDRFRAVVVVGADEPGSLAALAIEGVAGVRVNLVGRRVPDLRAPGWRGLAGELARCGQHLEVQAHGEQWEILAPALRTWPSTVVLDHLGLPGASARADRTVLSLAGRGHVWCKASAPYRSSGAAVDRMLARVADEAGTDRMVWGSDWPWTRHEHGRTYLDCLAWLEQRVDGDVFRAAVADNPARLLRWSPAPVSRGSVVSDAEPGA